MPRHAIPAILLATFVTFPAAATARAQTPADTFALAPVVVTATGVPTRADRLPVNVTVLRGKDLEARGIRTVAQALRLVPGVTVVETSSYGSQTSLFLRGGESDYAKVLVDGVPQSQPGVGFDFANLTTDDIDRIEIVEGPVSVLYGSDAVTGVVQIFTREGAGPAHAALSVQGGTYGSTDLGVSAGGGGERGSWSLGASRFSSDGSLPVNNHYRNGAFSGRLVWHPAATTRAALSLRYDDGLYHFPTTYPGAPLSTNQHDRERGPSVGLDLTHAFSRLDVGLTGTWRRQNLQYAIVPNDSTDTYNLPYASSDWMTRQGVEGRAVLHFAGSDALTAGATFEHQEMEGTTLGNVRTRDDGAGFLELVSGLERPLGFTLGARLEDNQRYGSFATYRAGVTYRVAGGTRLRGGVGTAFKEPTLYQNFAKGFVTGNQDLRPERSTSWEAGVEHELGRVIVRGTYFDEHFHNQIDYEAGATPNYQNARASWARGVELSVHAPLGTWGTVAAGYTYLRTHVTDGDTGSTALFRTGLALVRRPAHSATLTLTAGIPGGGSAAVTTAYVGSRSDIDFDAGGRVTLPAYTRVDLSAEYPLTGLGAAWAGVRVRARVDNAFASRYQEVASFPARGRTISFGGSWTVGSH